MSSNFRVGRGRGKCPVGIPDGVTLLCRVSASALSGGNITSDPSRLRRSVVRVHFNLERTSGPHSEGRASEISAGGGGCSVRLLCPGLADTPVSSAPAQPQGHHTTFCPTRGTSAGHPGISLPAAHPSPQPGAAVTPRPGSQDLSLRSSLFASVWPHTTQPFQHPGPPASSVQFSATVALFGALTLVLGQEGSPGQNAREITGLPPCGCLLPESQF